MLEGDPGRGRQLDLERLNFLPDFRVLAAADRSFQLPSLFEAERTFARLPGFRLEPFATPDRSSDLLCRSG